MVTAVLLNVRRLAWLILALVAMWLLAGCVDKHRDDNPYITPYGYSTIQPYG